MGENRSGNLDRNRCETRVSSHSHQGRKAAHVAVGIEKCVSWEFMKLPNVGFTSCWCLIPSVSESGWEFLSGSVFSQDARPRECSTLDVLGLVIRSKTMFIC